MIVELDKDKQARVNLLRFRKILTVLVDEGRDVFRGEHYVKFAKLTEELNKLVDEVEAQQSESKQTHFFP